MTCTCACTGSTRHQEPARTPPSTQQGVPELADYDEPGNNWIFGEKAEVREGGSLIGTSAPYRVSHAPWAVAAISHNEPLLRLTACRFFRIACLATSSASPVSWQPLCKPPTQCSDARNAQLSRTSPCARVIVLGTVVAAELAKTS